MTRSFETLTSPYLDGESPFTNAVSFSRTASPALEPSGELEPPQGASEAENDPETESLIAEVEAEWRALSEATDEAEEVSDARREEETELELETETDAETEFEVDADFEAKAEADAPLESASDSELELGPQTELELDSESESHEEPQPELEAEEELETETEQEFETETHDTEQDEAESEDTEYEDGATAGQKTLTARVLLDTPIQRGDSFELAGKVLGSDDAKQLLPGEYFLEFDKIASGKAHTLLHYHGDGFSTKTPVSKKVKRTTFLKQFVKSKQTLANALPVMQLLALKVQVPEKLKERTGREVALDPDLRGRSPTLVHLKVSEP